MHVVLAICRTFELVNHFLLLIINLTEWSLTLSLVPSMILIRLNRNLELIIDKITEEVKDGKIFENDEEKLLYYKYNNFSYKFGKYTSIFQGSIVALMFCRPLIHLLVHSYSGHSNVTLPYHLPYLVTYFVDYKHNALLYFSLYAFEIPLNYSPMFHIAEVSFIVTLVLHVCGRFSILSCRIRRIPTHSLYLYQDNIKRIVREHVELRKLSTNINDSIYLVLLFEYCSCTYRLGLSLYVTITLVRVDMVAATNFIMYSLDVLLLLFVYSYIGEKLVNESENIGEELYHTKRPEALTSGGKYLIICMMNGQKKEYMTAGKFYKFTLFGYTDIVKFSMACLSLLQAKLD